MSIPGWCWVTVYDASPASTRHWVSLSSLLEGGCLLCDVFAIKANQKQTKHPHDHHDDCFVVFPSIKHPVKKVRCIAKITENSNNTNANKAVRLCLAIYRPIWWIHAAESYQSIITKKKCVYHKSTEIRYYDKELWTARWYVRPHVGLYQPIYICTCVFLVELRILQPWYPSLVEPRTFHGHMINL